MTETLIENPRAFDVECVRSALEFVNRINNGHPHPAQSFSWAPAVCARRVKRAGFNAFEMTDRIREPQPKSATRMAREFLLTLSCALPPDQQLVNVQEIRDWLLRPENVRKQVYKPEWTEFGWTVERCDVIPVDPGKRKPAISVPMLADIGTCLGYALAILLSDEYLGLATRIRLCRYRGRLQNEPAHFFLDYRLDKAGRLKRGSPLAFCCVEHANRFRQREWRQRHVDKERKVGVKNTMRRQRR